MIDDDDDDDDDDDVCKLNCVMDMVMVGLTDMNDS